MMHDMHDLQCLNAGITPGCYNRPLGLFTSTDWKNHVSKFEERTSDKNKLDNKKRIWMVQGVQELCHRTWMGRGKENC